MTKRGRKQQDEVSVRHPLLVYRQLGRRYRPPAVLLMAMGIFAVLPALIPELENEDVDPDALAVLGIVLILTGLAFWLFSVLAVRRSYVECMPHLMQVRTPFYRKLVSYRRIRDVRSEPVAKLYENTKLRGIGKPLVKPLVGGMAAVVQMRSWPSPPRRLRRMFGKYLFSPREGEDAWVFIVPNYSVLVRQLEEARLRKIDQDRGMHGYRDPIDRLQRH